MNSQDLNNLQEAYLEVYQLDEDKRPIYGRGGAIRKTETPLQIYGKQATARDKRTKHNIPKGGTTIDKRDPDELFSGDYDRGSGNAAKRRAAALTKPEATKFPNRLTRSDKQGIKDSYEYQLDELNKRTLQSYQSKAKNEVLGSMSRVSDTTVKRVKGLQQAQKRLRDKKYGQQKEEADLYDIILSHLLDEGYADTQEQAEVIMVNMSEDWRESIVEAMKPLPYKKMMKKSDELASSDNKNKQKRAAKIYIAANDAKNK